jgi:hypothetical protein
MVFKVGRYGAGTGPVEVGRGRRTAARAREETSSLPRGVRQIAKLIGF